MGVQFNELIPKKEISLKDLKNKTIAIDSMNILYQFLSSGKRTRFDAGRTINDQLFDLLLIIHGL